MVNFKTLKMLKFIREQAVYSRFLISINHNHKNLVLAKKTANLSEQFIPVSGSHQSVLFLLTFRFVKFVSHLTDLLKRKEYRCLLAFSKNTDPPENLNRLNRTIRIKYKQLGVKALCILLHWQTPLEWLSLPGC